MTRPMRTWLGLDIGTSAGKALVAGEDGAGRGPGRAAWPVDVPARGLAEADPAAWLDAAAAAVREAGAGAAEAIGLSGQMHGVVLCDDVGVPVRPAILWPDGRA